MTGEAASSALAPVASRPAITVRALLEDEGLGIALSLGCEDVDQERQITHARIQKSGLALAGHLYGIVPTRIQVLGQTELSFLHALAPAERAAAISAFFGLGLSLVVVSEGDQPHDGLGSGASFFPPPELLDGARGSGTALALSSARSSSTIAALHALLDDRLAPRVRLHGVLVDIFGVGVLLVGSSGIGKSECALDLVLRGHRLVADDVVDCDYRPPGHVYGAPADLLRHHIEVRGLGILNIKDLYGVTAVRDRKRVDVVVRLVEWSEEMEYDRLGLDDRHHLVLGLPIRELIIPVRPGRDMASILEVVARNELLRKAGHHPAREFFERLEGTLLEEPHGAKTGERARPGRTVSPVARRAR